MLHNYPMTSSEVEILYKNTYIPTMQYIMPFTLEQLIHALNNENQLGSLIRTTVKNWFWHTGFSPFDNHHINVTHNKTKWLQCISDFVHTHNIHLVCAIQSEKLARKGDVYIMEQAYMLNLSNTEICQLLLVIFRRCLTC
jgi:hypothetical protein